MSAAAAQRHSGKDVTVARDGSVTFDGRTVGRVWFEDVHGGMWWAQLDTGWAPLWFSDVADAVRYLTRRFR